jgi:hypothetical protein
MAGMTIGSVISGALVERFGYYQMTWILSESFSLSLTPMVLPDLLRCYVHHHGHLSLYLPRV